MKRKIFRFLGFFLNLLPVRFILKFFGFFRTSLVVANKISSHIEVLLFSTSFIISVRFGDVETEKYVHSVSPAARISLYFPSIKIFRFFFDKRRKIFCLYFIKCWKFCVSEAVRFSAVTESETSLSLEQDEWSERSDVDVQAVHPPVNCATSGHGAKPKQKAVSGVIMD